MKKISIIVMISLCIILMFYTSFSFAAEVYATRAKVDIQYGKVVKIIGYLVILLFGVKDIIAEVQKGDVQAVGSVVIKYLIVYAALLGLPIGLRWVEEFIEGLK